MNEDDEEEYFFYNNDEFDENIMIVDDNYDGDGDDMTQNADTSDSDDVSSMEMYNNRFYYEIFEEMYSIDVDYIESEKVNGSYYLGQYVCVPFSNELLMANSVSPYIFFRYPYKIVLDYLRYYNFLLYKSDMKLHILQVCVQNNTYYVIVKTIWIKIIQRRWRAIYQKRKWIIQQRMRIQSLEYMKINGRYPKSLNTMPKLYGMLLDLVKFTRKSLNIRTD